VVDGDYDAALIGIPIWDVQPSMIMATFVEADDMSEKRLLPFVTYRVSGLGNTVNFYSELCPGSTVEEGLAGRGDEAAEAQPAIAEWLRQNGLTEA
jgi:hypothetical protein